MYSGHQPTNLSMHLSHCTTAGCHISSLFCDSDTHKTGPHLILSCHQCCFLIQIYSCVKSNVTCFMSLSANPNLLVDGLDSKLPCKEGKKSWAVFMNCHYGQMRLWWLMVTMATRLVLCYNVMKGRNHNVTK
jgi:hypothetical protein